MNNQQECCPRFDPAPWDGKTFEWDNKKFIKDKVFTLFYIPLNFGSIITKISKKLANNNTRMLDGLCLCDSTSKWNMDIYFAVDKEIPGIENTTMSGKFISKVYEGDFKETGKWCNDFQSYAKNQGLDLKKIFMWYTTCPKCAKKYGKNYIVIVGKI